MGIYGEVTKFLWFLCESIKEEPDACYIMATEFASVGVPLMMLMEPEWTYKKAQVSKEARLCRKCPHFCMRADATRFIVDPSLFCCVSLE
jgi:hypothetical protein